MTKLKKIQTSDSIKKISELQQTNRLFLDLLYNLSKYPHTNQAKHFVRLGLFDFEEKNVLKSKSTKVNK